MKVLFVVNNAFAKGNGLSASCRRTVKYLKERGIDHSSPSGGNSSIMQQVQDKVKGNKDEVDNK